MLLWFKRQATHPPCIFVKFPNGTTAVLHQDLSLLHLEKEKTRRCWGTFWYPKTENSNYQLPTANYQLPTTNYIVKKQGENCNYQLPWDRKPPKSKPHYQPLGRKVPATFAHRKTPTHDMWVMWVKHHATVMHFSIVVVIHMYIYV